MQSCLSTTCTLFDLQRHVYYLKADSLSGKRVLFHPFPDRRLLIYLSFFSQQYTTLFTWFIDQLKEIHCTYDVMCWCVRQDIIELLFSISYPYYFIGLLFVNRFNTSSVSNDIHQTTLNFEKNDFYVCLTTDCLLNSD